MSFHCLAHLQGTPRWRFRGCKEDKGHPVSGWKPNEFDGLFCGTELLRTAHDLIKLVHDLALLVNRKSRIFDNVHEQDMGYLWSKIGFYFSGHKNANAALSAWLFVNGFRLGTGNELL